jgi:adenosylcobinamide-phosphate synthase
LGGEVATRLSDLLTSFVPDPYWLGCAAVADLLIGDPTYAWHPIRLVGRALTGIEEQLRAAGLDGYGGGVLLFAGLSVISVAVLAMLLFAAATASSVLAVLVHVFVLYSLLALGDLLHHVWQIERAVRAGDLPRARVAVSALVGRDTDRMDGAACRRAAVESLSENLTDGFVSPVFWYVIGGLPGIVLFKVVSTMDSMVGYKTPRYLQFGWCGARLDDVMNYVPARVTWLGIVLLAAMLPTYSGRKAWGVGLSQHAVLLGPNSGWSEAATAGALQRRIVGPIWLRGEQVTDVWIGRASDPPLETGADVTRATVLATLCGVMMTAGAIAIIASAWSS